MAARANSSIRADCGTGFDMQFSCAIFRIQYRFNRDYQAGKFNRFIEPVGKFSIAAEVKGFYASETRPLVTPASLPAVGLHRLSVVVPPARERGVIGFREAGRNSHFASLAAIVAAAVGGARQAGQGRDRSVDHAQHAADEIARRLQQLIAAVASPPAGNQPAAFSDSRICSRNLRGIFSFSASSRI